MPAAASTRAVPGADEAADEAIVYRMPTSDDGARVTALIADCPPLDVNSAYCNLLQCAHFAATCVVAERGSALVGWISGYRPPSDSDALFVWQVAVHPAARGSGLGRHMIEAILDRPSLADATRLITTVTEANAASWAMFEGFARSRGVDVVRTPMFDRDVHFDGQHDTEWLASIGPLVPPPKTHA